MIQIIHFRNDIKQIMRDPIMVLMLVAPIFLILIFKLLVMFLIPFIYSKTGFNVSPYHQYILASMLIINSSLLGVVTGFLMLDERDGNIAELMSVTPLGRSGYLINRLSFASILSFIYCITGYYVLNLAELPLFTVIFLAALSAIYSAITGLLLFSGADDKVKGLTFAKGLNALILFALADLFALRWLTVIAWFFPPYWVTMLIKSPDSIFVYGISFVVLIGWLVLLILSYWRKRS